ncbi:MAG: hypothetical protein H6865_01145 [Rhodospirillales bacterium]|nr:hypothetical protein [Alphaproteobacteria bacterium]MCB9986232.1 hypothetical protein [Rhodospirillales bacterium]USO07213.1 MAG: hypothetical protein H6866_07225 [Rhodospirillales bacterium]
MSRQSTRHLLMIEPSQPGFNPETAATNDYQIDVRENATEVAARYLREFRDFRDRLVASGVFVTTVQGPKKCPDVAFPNWFSTHEEQGLVIYPMLTPNRRAERMPGLINLLKRYYGLKMDMAFHEEEGKALESTGSLVLDRVHRVAYCGRSARTDEGLAREWCNKMGYEPLFFDTVDHTGKPVYHTDVVMWVGSEVAGVCSGAIIEKDRERVLKSLSAHREVVEFDNSQLRAFCGNAIEAQGTENQLLLIMSERAYGALNSDQRARLSRYYATIVTGEIPTIETYGGGSARCMVQELF